MTIEVEKCVHESVCVCVCVCVCVYVPAHSIQCYSEICVYVCVYKYIQQSIKMKLCIL
jgi:hypothetical protein